MDNGQSKAIKTIRVSYAAKGARSVECFGGTTAADF